MSWLRKALVHLALSRSDAALIKASGGAPRIVRDMQLDPRFQFLEYQTRQRAADWGKITVSQIRAQTEQGAMLVAPAPQVRESVCDGPLPFGAGAALSAACAR